MYIYIIMLLFLIFMSYIYRKTNLSRIGLCTVCFFLLVSVEAVRALDVGIDLPMYIRYFLAVGKVNHNRFEIGYFYLNRFIKLFSDNPQVFVGSVSVITNLGPFFVIYKKAEKPEMSIILYFLHNFYFMTFNTIRQSIAVSLILISYIFFDDAKYIRTLLFIVSAMFFHNSAVIFFIAFIGYFVFKYIKKKRNIMLLFLGVSYFSYIFVLPYLKKYAFSGYYSYYRSNLSSHFIEANNFGSVLYVLVYLTISIWGISCIKKSKNIPDNQYYFQLCCMFIATGCSLLSIQIELLSRFTHYFAIFSILFLPKVILIKKENNSRYGQLYTVMVYSVAFLYWICIAWFRPQWFGAIPYSCFWN